MRIDLNADAGESYGVWSLGQDQALLALVTSVNLACGFHAGDPLTIQRAVRTAKEKGVAVGAHPGFPDRLGFGRRQLDASPEEIYADVLYQIGALSAFVRAEELTLHHVKPHGALYIQATRLKETARAIASAVKDFDPTLPLVVLPNTVFEHEAQSAGLRTIAEAFPERGYTREGLLASRGTEGAVIHDPRLAAQRALQMVTKGLVESVDGSLVAVRADTLCIHGDNPAALAIAGAVREGLEASGIEIRAF